MKTEFGCSSSRLRAEHPTFRRKRFFTGHTVRTGPEGAERLNDIVWLHPEGHPMEDEDWEGADRVLGMYLNGHGIAGRDPRGQVIEDDHFLLYFNAADFDVEVTLPPEEYAAGWRVAIDTAGDGEDTDRREAGSTTTVASRSVLVLQEYTAPEAEVDHSVAASIAAQAQTASGEEG